MERSAKVIILSVIYIGFVNCSIIKKEENRRHDEPSTTIIESIHDVTGKDYTSTPCSEEQNSDIVDDTPSSKLSTRILTTLDIPRDTYADENQNVRLPDNDFRGVLSNSQSSMESEVQLPETENSGALGVMNRHMYPRLFAIRPLPFVNSLPSVYLTRPHVITPYQENGEPLNYDPYILNSQDTVLLPVNIRPQRTLSSEEEFWAELTQDAIIKNIIPTMEVPMPRNSYGQHTQLLRVPYPLSVSERMSNEPAIALYPETESRDCALPFLANCKPKISLGTTLSDSYQDIPYSRIMYRRQTLPQKQEYGK